MPGDISKAGFFLGNPHDTLTCKVSIPDRDRVPRGVRLLGGRPGQNRNLNVRADGSHESLYDVPNGTAVTFTERAPAGRSFVGIRAFWAMSS